jgi:anti-anti-sigma factor
MPFIGDPRTEFSVSMRYDTEVSVIAVRGELTGSTVPRMQPAIEAAVTARGPVVVDLDEVSFMDSQGLFALLVLRERLGGRRATPPAVVCRPDGVVATLFRVSGTHELFELCRSRTAAVAVLRR